MLINFCRTFYTRPGSQAGRPGSIYAKCMNDKLGLKLIKTRLMGLKTLNKQSQWNGLISLKKIFTIPCRIDFLILI